MVNEEEVNWIFGLSSCFDYVGITLIESNKKTPVEVLESAWDEFGYLVLKLE